MSSRRRGEGARSEVRIVGGFWRGRRISFPDRPRLRPTPDRVRETVFNWLQGWLAGARCLDLFAGSGALGFEAASRGAKAVVLVDADAVAASRLRRTATELGSDRVTVVHADAMRFLRTQSAPFDVVFLDPPYDQELLEPATRVLAERSLLSTPALVYLEAEATAGVPMLPANWELLRTKRCGDVGYHLALAQREPACGRSDDG